MASEVCAAVSCSERRVCRTDAGAYTVCLTVAATVVTICGICAVCRNGRSYPREPPLRTSGRGFSILSAGTVARSTVSAANETRI